jgi:hypothetical protein
MAAEPTLTKQEHQKQLVVHHGGGSNAVYGIGLIGAWVYYFQHATTNQERIQAFFKGLVWPAFLVYELFVFLKKE